MRKAGYITVLILFLFSTVIAQEVQTDSVGRVFIERGNNLAATGDYQKALREYQRGLIFESGDKAILHYNIGVCYYHLGLTQKAVQEYKTAIRERRGEYQKAWRSLGVAHSELKDWTNAKAAFKKAIEQSNGADAEACFELGMVLVHERDYKSAIDCFQQAIKHGGKFFPASHNNLGVMYAKTGNLDQAKREFEIALKQSDGRLEEAVTNLKLCQTLLASNNEALAANFKMTETKSLKNRIGEE
jgi:tetratricopeptide (TPR) repeat protein